MTTDYTPHSPQSDYTATINITGTKQELSDLYDLLNQALPINSGQERILKDVLRELQDAHGWITDMEDIARRTGE